MTTETQAQPAPVEGMLYEHDDGRYAVSFIVPAPFSDGEPAWHRVGPVAVHSAIPAPEGADERAAFERWAENRAHRLNISDRHPSEYASMTAQEAWEAWQARAALAAQPAGTCPCGDRPAAECEEQWGPQCDMGNNPTFAKAAPAPAEGDGAEPLYLVHAGGDCYQGEIVPESELDDAYLLTQWFSLDDISAEERADALAHFHDDDAWTHTEVNGKGERLKFDLTLEDGWIEVIRLPAKVAPKDGGFVRITEGSDYGKPYAATLHAQAEARAVLEPVVAAISNPQPKGTTDDARSAKAALADLELLPEDRAPLEAIVAAGYQHARSLKAAQAEPHGWVVWWPAMGGGHKPIYTHGPKKPSYGPELGSKLRLYPVYRAAQAPAPAHACNCPNIGACDGSCAPYVGKRDDPHDPLLAEAWEMAKRLEPAAAEIMRKLCKRLREDDRMLSQTIDEREERQQFIDDLLDALHGPDRHEWTSAYGFNDAMEDALERLAALEAATPAPAVGADDDNDLDSRLEEAWSENEALKEELAEFQKATGFEHAEDVPARSPHRQHGYGTCTITGPDEDVAFIFKHLPDVVEAVSDGRQTYTAAGREFVGGPCAYPGDDTLSQPPVQGSQP